MAPNNQTPPDWRQKMAKVIAEINKIKRPTQRRAMMKLFFPGQNGVTVPSETRLATTTPEMMTIGAMYDDAVAAIPEQEVVRQLGQLVAQKTQEITQDPVKRSALIKYFSPYTPLMTQQELDYIYEKSASDPDFSYMYQYYSAILSTNFEEINKFNASNPTTPVTMPYPITNYKAIEPAINEEISRETSGLVPPTVLNGVSPSPVVAPAPAVSAPAPAVSAFAPGQSLPVPPAQAVPQQANQTGPVYLAIDPKPSSFPSSQNSRSGYVPSPIPSVWSIPGVSSPIEPRENTRESIAKNSENVGANNKIASLFAASKPDELRNFVNATAFVSNGTVPENPVEEQAMYGYIQSQSELWGSWVEKNFGDKDYFNPGYVEPNADNYQKTVDLSSLLFDAYNSLSEDKKNSIGASLLDFANAAQDGENYSNDQINWFSSDDPIAAYARQKILESVGLNDTKTYKIAQKSFTESLSERSFDANSPDDQMYQVVTGIVQNDENAVLPEASPQFMAASQASVGRKALSGQRNAPDDQMYLDATGIVQNDPNWIAPVPDPIASAQQKSRRLGIAARQAQNIPQYEMYSEYGGVLSQTPDSNLDPVAQAIINLKKQRALSASQRNAPQEEMYSGITPSVPFVLPPIPAVPSILSNEQLYQGFTEKLADQNINYANEGNQYFYNVPESVRNYYANQNYLNPIYAPESANYGVANPEYVSQDQMYSANNKYYSGYATPENTEDYRYIVPETDPELSSDWKNRSPIYAPESINHVPYSTPSPIVYGPPGYVSQNQMYSSANMNSISNRPATRSWGAYSIPSNSEDYRYSFPEMDPELSSDWKNRSPIYAPESINYGPPAPLGYVSQNQMYPQSQQNSSSNSVPKNKQPLNSEDYRYFFPEMDPELSSDWKNRSPVYAPESINYGPPAPLGYVSQNQMYPQSQQNSSSMKLKENAPQDKMYKNVVDGYVEPPPQNPAYSSNLYLGTQLGAPVNIPPEQYGPSAMSGYPWQQEKLRNSTEPWVGYKNRRPAKWGGY